MSNEIPERMANEIDDEGFDKVQPVKRCPSSELHTGPHIWFRNGNLNDAWKCLGKEVPKLKHRPEDQPLPTKNDSADIQSLVILDIKARRELGKQRYGTALQPFNGRDPDRDLYEELLDALMYQKQRMVEQEASEEELAKIAHDYLERKWVLDEVEDISWEELDAHYQGIFIGLIRVLRVAASPK